MSVTGVASQLIELPTNASKPRELSKMLSHYDFWDIKPIITKTSVQLGSYLFINLKIMSEDWHSLSRSLVFTLSLSFYLSQSLTLDTLNS